MPDTKTQFLINTILLFSFLIMGCAHDPYAAHLKGRAAHPLAGKIQLVFRDMASWPTYYPDRVARGLSGRMDGTEIRGNDFLSAFGFGPDPRENEYDQRRSPRQLTITFFEGDENQILLEDLEDQFGKATVLYESTESAVQFSKPPFYLGTCVVEGKVRSPKIIPQAKMKYISIRCLGKK